MSHRTKKYTLASRTGQRLNQSLQESIFFSTPIRIFNFFSPTLRCFNFFFHRTVHNLTVCASNVNRFGESVCVIRTEPLRGESMPAANKKLSEILKKGGLVVNQTVVLLMKCVQVKIFATEESGRNLYLFVAKIFVNSCPSYSPFFKTSPSPCALGASVSNGTTNNKRTVNDRQNAST